MLADPRRGQHGVSHQCDNAAMMMPDTVAVSTNVDTDRRFAALDRLYGTDAAARLRAANVAVVGLGGVGGWTVEALARCGVGGLTLVDLDHIAESNVNRQIHALTSTLGQAKVTAMAERVLGIQPGCRVHVIDEFVTPENAEMLLAPTLDVIVDATDQIAAKVAMIRLAHARGQGLVVCGGAGGKTDPLALRAGDLALACHDALLTRLRAVLRKQHGYPKPSGQAGRRRVPKLGVRALWLEQSAVLPSAWQTSRPTAPAAPQGLACAGYGSSVMVTATMGLAAAHEAVQQILVTTSQSASLAGRGEVKRGSHPTEPKAPLTGGGEAPTVRSEFFTPHSQTDP